ncbi:SPOR domain-containing protein [Phenylobacterium sp.]|uniref:SPOR domain-containing protein n=1 Tax=Phenylobacterium sp. TaxID=1871053 RepID=UPI0025D68D3B|nr:SPOR domain-containing protein [Phenylobacterium sp.]
MQVGGVWALAAGVWLAGAGVSWGQNAPPTTYPPSMDREPLLTWLQRETDIQPDKVVAVTPQAVTSVMSTFPAAPGQSPRVVIRAEALSPETVAHTGALSWHVSMNADCESHKVRLGETTGYAERNLLGERKLLRAAENDWRTPDDGTALEAAWRAACRADFRGPFQAADAQPAVGTPQAPVAPVREPPPPRPVDAKAAAAKPVPSKPAPSPTPRATPAGPAAGALAVQVGATPSEAEASSLLASLRPKLGGRRAWIETAQVGGKTWRRVLVGGFTDGGEASRFCADLKAAGRACFVRPARTG